MSDRIEIVVDEEHSNLLMRSLGMIEALEALNAAKKMAVNAPGFGLALAIIEKEVAEYRAQIAGLALRAVAKAGHDITRHPNVYSSINKDGRAVLQIDPPDLLSEAGP